MHFLQSKNGVQGPPIFLMFFHTEDLESYLKKVYVQ